MNKIAKAMGYTGDMGQFQSYIEQDPMRQQQMQRYTNAAMQMARGGVVKMQTGGLLPMGQGTGPLMAEPEENYLTGTKDQYDAFRKQYMQGGPRIETADVRQLPIQGGGFQGSSTEFGAFQDYLRGQQQAISFQQTGSPLGPLQGVLGNQNPVYRGVGVGPVNNRAPSQSAPGNLAQAQGLATTLSKYGSGFRQPGDMGKYVAFNDPGQPGEGFANAAEYEAAQRGQTTPPAAQTSSPNITQTSIDRMFQPGLPVGGVTQAAMTPSEMGQYVDPRVGTLTGAVAVPTTMAQIAGAAPVQEQQSAQMQAATAAPAVDAAVQATQAAQGTVDPRAQVTAAQQTASSVGDIPAAQGNAILIDNPVQRNIQSGELISGAAADAQTAATFTEQVQAAEATPTSQATVQGQLAQLTANFDASNPPAWAAGALRNANAQMVARGLGSSSIAAQAIVQATMEAALPIAQADAAVTAQFEAQNLSNRQQRAMLAAQQRATFLGQEFDQAFQARVQNASRIADIANQNFTAEQQVQLENSRIANTMNLQNLSNRQAIVIAEASALANMDLSNLNNRQQAAVQNAQSFLQMDMTNLSNQQQTETFKAQQRIQSLFTDQAAENAARQFNATSQNQVDQFFASLANQVSQFNAAQINAQGQFNAGQANTIERFNAELNNQRDQFNAQNQIAIAQGNAQWRRQIATADTAAVNAANQLNAQAVLGISEQAYENLWQYFADTMEFAWTTADNEADRQARLAVAQMQADNNIDVAKLKGDYESSQAVGGFVTDILKIGLSPGGFMGL
jgi:hypothetical protein